MRVVLSVVVFALALQLVRPMDEAGNAMEQVAASFEEDTERGLDELSEAELESIELEDAELDFIGEGVGEERALGYWKKVMKRRKGKGKGE